LGVVAVLVFLALNGPIIEALEPNRCQGQADCPDPGTQVFAYVVVAYALASVTARFVIAAMRGRGERRLDGRLDPKAR